MRTCTKKRDERFKYRGKNWVLGRKDDKVKVVCSSECSVCMAAAAAASHVDDIANKCENTPKRPQAAQSVW